MGLLVFILLFTFVPFFQDNLHLLDQLLLVRNIEHIAKVGKHKKCLPT